MIALVDQVLAETDWRRNPYFVALRDGTFGRDDFVETQVQFFHAVAFFSRPMAALAAKIPSVELRMEILRNVWEEHGEGNPGLTHGSTFRELLRRLDGIDDAAIDRRTLWPEVRVFNTALAGACLLDEYVVGCATLGMIERMFCEISAELGQRIVDRGFLPPDRLVHYDVHETLDVRHALDFFKVLEPVFDQPADRYFVEQGLRMGAVLFMDLYEGLYRGRARRWERTVRGPQGRV